MGGRLKAREREEAGRKEGRGAPQVDRPPATACLRSAGWVHHVPIKNKTKHISHGSDLDSSRCGADLGFREMGWGLGD